MLATRLIAVSLLVPTGDSPALCEGDQVWLRLEPRGELVIQLCNDLTSPCTLWVDSAEIDVRLEVEGQSGSVSVDDSHGRGTGEFRRLEASPSAAKQVRVRAADGRGGEVHARVIPGHGPPPAAELRTSMWIDRIERRIAEEEAQNAWSEAVRLHLLLAAWAERSELPEQILSRISLSEGAANNSGQPHDRLSVALARSALLRERGRQREAAELLESLQGLIKPDLCAEIRAGFWLETGLVQLAQGKLPESTESLARSAELARESGSQTHLARAATALGQTAESMGDSGAAERHYVDAARALRSVEDPRVRVEVLVAQAQWKAAMDRHREAIALFEEALASDPPLLCLVSILGNLASSRERTGELEAASRDLEACSALARRLGRRGDEARAITLQGNILIQRKRPKEAKEHLAEALAIHRSRGDALGVGEALMSLAEASAMCSDVPGQVRAARELLELAERHSITEFEVSARIHLGMGLLLEDPAESESQLRSAAQIARERGGRYAEANVLGTTAHLLHQLGRNREAIGVAHAGVSAYLALDQDLQAMQVLETAVAAALAEANVDVAETAIDQALERLRNDTLVPALVGESNLIDSVFAEFEPHVHDLVALQQRKSPEDDRAVAAGLERAGLFRSRSLMQALVQRRIGQPDEARRSRQREFEAARSSWRALIEALGGTKDRAEMSRRAADIADVRRRFDEAWDALASSVARSMRTASAHDLTAISVRSALPDAQSALVAYVPGGQRLYAYVVTNDALKFLDLGERESLEARAALFIEALSGRKNTERTAGTSVLNIGGLSACVSLGRELNESLLAPVRAVIGKSVNCLLVVPTGRLIGVPFDALVEGDEPASMKFPAGRPRFVVEQLTIAYLPSVPVLLELARLPARASSYRPAVVMGGPDYSIIASGDSRSPIPPWPDLPDAREEAVDVASMLEVRADGTLRPGASERFEQLRRGRGPEAHSAWRSPDVELYVGSLVTRSEFLARAPAAKLLHIASHGFFDPQDVLESALILSAEDEQGRRLTARDILALDLAASVTVLAGCDTGRGDAGASEGMLSLAGAFIYAGSRAVVASSWSAADGATRRLSRRFYVGLIEEALGPCEALRRAKTELITTGTRGIGVSDGGASETPGLVHPRVWATFAYVGLP